MLDQTAYFRRILGTVLPVLQAMYLFLFLATEYVVSCLTSHEHQSGQMFVTFGTPLVCPVALLCLLPNASNSSLGGADAPRLSKTPLVPAGSEGPAVLGPSTAHPAWQSRPIPTPGPE